MTAVLLCLAVPALAQYDLTVCANKGFTLASVADAAGVEPVTYQWYENGSPIENSNTATISIPEGGKAPGAYAYVRVAANSACTLSSNTYTVVVNELPAAPTTASANSRCGSGAVTFSATPGTDCTIDWYDASTGGSIVSGGTGVTSIRPSLTVTITYYAASRNTTTGCVSSTRLAVTGTVLESPTISTQPQGDTICPGTTAQLSVAATNAASYQWRKNRVNTSEGSGYTTDTYTTAALSAGATYQCLVTAANGCTVTTASAIVAVTPATVAVAPDVVDACQGEAITLTTSALYAGYVTWLLDSAPATAQSGYQSTTFTPTFANAGTYIATVDVQHPCVTENTAVSTIYVKPKAAVPAEKAFSKTGCYEYCRAACREIISSATAKTLIPANCTSSTKSYFYGDGTNVWACIAGTTGSASATMYSSAQCRCQ
jgi:hypothetical protein